MSPPQPPIEIPEHDDTALRILGAYAVKDRRFLADQAAAEASEKAKREAEQAPPDGS
ncbi:hypothetical protein LJR039_004356 [Pseudorhodoferax sp. LjRoot39]|uniref:hypothetical protein n=1 Tax=Pseudorhodoferax sp. LjRoot39 TaxID=3342328 RepID=UPI003ECC4F91